MSKVLEFLKFNSEDYFVVSHIKPPNISGGNWFLLYFWFLSVALTSELAVFLCRETEAIKG